MKKTNIKKTINDLEKKGYSIFNNFLSSQQCKKYKKLIDKLEKKNIFFEGRLASYRYLNMDEVIEAALNLFQKLKKKYS